MSFEIKRARGKTAVFSGTRQTTSNFLPRLEDLCIQKLLNNVGRIECVGDVPYYILRPLLTKISLAQLKRIESFNPALVADDESDEPWKFHCQRDFKGRIPARNESWRDFYCRCERERNREIEKIAKRIKRHEKKKTIPQRQVQVVSQPSTSSSSASSSSLSSGNRVIRRETKQINAKPTPTRTGPLMQKSIQLFKSRFRR